MILLSVIDFSIKIFKICHSDSVDIQKGRQINVWGQATPDRGQAIQKLDNPAKSVTNDHPSTIPVMVFGAVMCNIKSTLVVSFCFIAKGCVSSLNFLESA